MPATASSDGLPHDPKAVREEQQRIDLVARKRADENKAEIDQVAADAFVMGRNMFGPGRGEWDLSWTGWRGDNPPYHAPVFVLTHHSREPLAMEGGTTFTAVLAMVLLRTVPIPAGAEPEEPIKIIRVGSGCLACPGERLPRRSKADRAAAYPAAGSRPGR